MSHFTGMFQNEVAMYQKKSISKQMHVNILPVAKQCICLFVHYNNK